jgi:polyketide biosynthesis enoyl-CoA hydratase PksI
VVSLRQEDEGIVVVCMHDEVGRNALDAPLVAQLVECLGAVGRDEAVKVCILEGLPEVFCSGGTKEALMEFAAGRVTLSDIEVTRAMLAVPVPTIAAMQGHAVGGGLPLGLSADIVLMARTSRYGATFMNMGFTPGMGTTGLLPDAVGEHLAAEMMFGGQTFRGSRFTHSAGINYVLADVEVPAKARDLALRIAEKPRHALVLLKETLAARRRRAFEAAHTVELAMHEKCFERPETAAWIERTFLES